MALYRRVYLEGCTISLVLSSIILYTAATFGFELGVRAVAMMIDTFVLGFVVAFARLWRA